MAECKIVFTSRAWDDLEAIADHHMQRVGAAYAQAITNALLEDIEQLQDHPLIGPLCPDPVLAKHHYRKLVCKGYVCIYRTSGDTAYIYRIVHGSTNYPSWAVE